MDRRQSVLPRTRRGILLTGLTVTLILSYQVCSPAPNHSEASNPYGDLKSIEMSLQALPASPAVESLWIHKEERRWNIDGYLAAVISAGFGSTESWDQFSAPYNATAQRLGWASFSGARTGLWCTQEARIEVRDLSRGFDDTLLWGLRSRWRTLARLTITSRRPGEPCG